MSPTKKSAPPPASKGKGGSSYVAPSPVQKMSSGKLLAIVIGAVVVIAAVVAVLATQLGKSDKTATSGSPGTTVASGSSPAATTAPGGSTAPAGDGKVEQMRPVSVTGGELPKLEDPANDKAVGLAAPSISGSSFDGTPVNITPGNGKPMLLVFGAHWCPHCQKELPLIAQWMRTKKPADLQVYAIATGTNKGYPNYPPSSWFQKMEWPAPVLADSSAFQAAFAYGLPGYPYLVMIDANGKVTARTSGELPIDQLDAFVKTGMQ